MATKVGAKMAEVLEPERNPKNDVMGIVTQMRINAKPWHINTHKLGCFGKLGKVRLLLPLSLLVVCHPITIRMESIGRVL